MPSSSLAGTDHLAWYTVPAADAAVQLAVEPTLGLTTDEVTQRAARYGLNEIRERPPRPLWRMFLDQFTDFMILVLIGAAIISGVIGKPPDAIAILVIVMLNGVIGFIQEYRAERAVEVVTGALRAAVSTHNGGAADTPNTAGGKGRGLPSAGFDRGFDEEQKREGW